MKTVAFVEIDEYCQKVLRKHWKDVPIFSDIKTFGRKIFDEPVDLICGGFPCQPFSVAGKRKGTGDNRYLWPEMFRVIQEYQPAWVVAENVRGLVSAQQGVVFEQVCSDLEGEGYEVQPFVIPACAVNAPHRRERVWIIANRQCVGWEKGSRKTVQSQEQITEGQDSRDFDTERYDWGKNWYEVATRFCRVDDGVSNRVDRNKHRKDRLRCLGNAVVPQIVEIIGRGIISVTSVQFSLNYMNIL